MKTYPITTDHLRVDELRTVLTEDFQLELADEARKKMQVCRKFLEKKIAEPGKRYYGINTGFGSLCDVEIPNDQLEQLQENLTALSIQMPPELDGALKGLFPVE